MVRTHLHDSLTESTHAKTQFSTGIPTQARFRMPTRSGRQDNGWYSFEMGPVHFIVMDTEMNAFESSTQYDFFKSDLESVNRSVTPWIIFSGHRPMYSSSDLIPGLDLP